MSQDLVAAISSAASDPAVSIDRYQAQIDAVNMSGLDSAKAASHGGGASIQPLGSIEPQAAAVMNLQSLAGQFSSGLQHGFYAGDIDRLMHKLDLSHQPGSGVTFGDVTVELLNVQAKVGIADAFAKVSSKLSEGLQTMVVKQG